ncbi:MAG TPA: transporter [Methylomirabilota bacterium]|nr:transporter [Methylomirabilota bacterium]
MRLPAAVALAVALTAPAVASAQRISVEPDRPDQTSRPATLPRGAAQFEGGMVYERTGPDERAVHVEATLRFGLTDRFELRLEGEPFVDLRDGEDTSGFGDLTLSLRYRFLDARQDSLWPALAVQPYVKLPTAHEPIGSERTDFGLIFIAGLDLPGGFVAAFNAEVAAIGQRDPDGYLIQALATAGIGHDLIADTLGAYVEVLWSSPEERDGSSRTGIGTGLSWRVARRLAVDLGFEATVGGRGPDYIVRSGLGVLLHP